MDEERHILYIGTSNAYTGLANPADPTKLITSPYSDALLAINYDTGQVVWSYQFYKHDAWSQATGNVVNGLNDLDVRGHPQLFSVKGIDYVSVTGKDGSLRIFKRDQTSALAKPVVHLQFGPGTAAAGGISINPVIHEGIIYVASVAGVIDETMLGFLNNLPSNPFPDATLGQSISSDYLSLLYGQFGPFLFPHTRLVALDLEKLVQYGLSHPAGEKPLCYGVFWPMSLCSGQFPTVSGMTIYDKDLGVMSTFNSSGIAYNNGVLYIPNALGRYHPAALGNLVAVDAATGDIITDFNVALADPPIMGFLPNNLVVGGVSARNGKIYVPYGLYYGGIIVGDGGVVALGLPNRAKGNAK